MAKRFLHEVQKEVGEDEPVFAVENRGANGHDPEAVIRP
jgi:hypothetical protein